jgi:hypothetical protein
LIRGVTALAVAVTFMAGCGAATTSTPRSGTATPAPQASVTWMTEFCTAVGDLRASLWGSADGGTGTLRTRFESQLDAASTVLTTATDRLDALPDDSPSGGPAAVSTLAGRLGDLHDATVDGRESLTALPPNATESDVGRVMGAVWPEVASLAGDPLAEVVLTDAMKAAATDLSCRSLPGLR